ncbi:Uu.00g104520.m01.CDS01 [Anthostomella pinea]|uniref:U4/U6 snRNA-associated-splicing factor PRP24 n=1 Tax=Anthostomella pinea TaxID=933095 RepID=A0AAI8YFL7_9PEZI|nr:Uu.00g104520.m01.CDS01 [Anthostomella pinea]
MANPVGEDNWLAYVEEESRHATDLEARVKVVELFKSAISDEPASLNIWLAYCEWFWSLFTDCQSSDAGWPDDEQMLGRELFSFDAALSLWSEGYNAIKYRINDSHEFWNRWVSIELDQLARTRTPSGVKRISHLYRDRLQVPHSTWDLTSQAFSSLLSTYNNAAYESEFKEVTAIAQEAKTAYERRETHELELRKAIRSGDQNAQKTKMRQYLDWEMVQTKQSGNRALAAALCLGLYSRALSGICAFEDDVWSNCAIYVSDVLHLAKTTQLYHPLPNMIDYFQRATKHCPWSGPLWSRYILMAEESGWSFHNVESIKHAATNTKALDKNGMTGVLDMYTAWCGFLKRTAMDPNASEDAADVAEVGLLAALEDVDLWGKRLYKDAYQGDPNFRLQRILIQYLTEVKGDADDARRHWNRMADQRLLANSYDFWLSYYLWEMMIFSSQPKARSPTPATPAGNTKAMRVPSMATGVLQRAVAQKTLDWPERVMEVYLQHCNDYERPDTLHHALDAVYKVRRTVTKRRERESAEAAAVYAAQVQQAQEQAPATASHGSDTPNSPSGFKRKREATPGDAPHGGNKRVKSVEANGTNDAADQQKLKRDRENTSVLVTNLPPDATQTAIRKYFKEYGHINHIILQKEPDNASSSALIEFRSSEDVSSALLRDNKYYGQFQIGVKPGTGLTLFVSNYAPTADDAYIRNIFKDCGDILSIRWPSLKFNTHRRFCYVSFKDPNASYRASQLDGKLLDGKYKLQAKYSDPSHKKDREGAVAEGRELRVKNVHIDTQENDLKSVFGKYGKVGSVNMVKNSGGQNVGTAYIVFETKEQAEKALELDKTKFKSQILDVELSKESNFKPSATSRGERGSATASPAPSGEGDVAMLDGPDQSQGAGKGPTPKEIQDRTIAIMNVPDTVNDARVKAIVEKHGDLVKLVLRPDHQGAIVEFADAATVGRASLALEGFEIVPGRKLRVGSVRDLFKEKSETRQDKVVTGGGRGKGSGRGGGTANATFMPPPQTVRRPALGGRGGAKRGRLGFVAPKKKDDEEKTQTAAGSVNGTAPPKSNADFKAMFLGPAAGGGGGAARSNNGE